VRKYYTVRAMELKVTIHYDSGGEHFL